MSSLCINRAKIPATELVGDILFRLICETVRNTKCTMHVVLQVNFFCQLPTCPFCAFFVLFRILLKKELYIRLSSKWQILGRLLRTTIFEAAWLLWTLFNVACSLWKVHPCLNSDKPLYKLVQKWNIFTYKFTTLRISYLRHYLQKSLFYQRLFLIFLTYFTYFRYNLIDVLI